MRVLIVSQYFWPEYFRVNDLAKELKNSGHQVDILTGVPNYPKGKIFDDFKKDPSFYNKFEGCNIIRIPIIPRKKGSNLDIVLNYISFLISGLVIGLHRIRKKKYDLIITYATSPILVALISIFISKLKNARHIIWVQDLWPNVLNDLGILKKKNLIYFFFNKLVKFIYQNCDLILCQSLDFKKKILDYTNKFKNKIIFYPSWPEETFSINNKNLNKQDIFQFDKNFFNIVFAGNIGESQNFEFVLKVIKYNSAKNIKWHIIGEGRSYHKIKQDSVNLNISNISFYGLKKFTEIQYFLKNADCLLISLRYNETFKSTIPGKFQTYLQYKKKILGLLGGETSSIINKYKIGAATKKDNDLSEATQIIDDLMLKRFELKEKNFDLLLKIYSKKRLIKKLNFYIDQLFKVKKIKFNLINRIRAVDFNKNFIISALNLAFLAYFFNKKIIVNNDFYLWPDGYFKKDFFNKVANKKPGRVLLNELNLDNTNIKRIIVLGNLDKNGTQYIKTKFIDLKLLHINLPYGEIDSFTNLLPTLNISDLVIMTIPTPKQEILANYIRSTQKNFKIICIGGAINMLSGTEKIVPDLLNRFYFGEALWRLQFDFKRRIKRLTSTLFYYLKGNKKKYYKIIEINEII